jgi:hypothetical protein
MERRERRRREILGCEPFRCEEKQTYSLVCTLAWRNGCGVLHGRQTPRNDATFLLLVRKVDGQVRGHRLCESSPRRCT